MLDLHIIAHKLTQGQPEAVMRVAAANPPHADIAPTAPLPQPEAASPSPPPVDAQAVARRVYALMRRELTLEHDRRAGNLL